MSDRKEYAGGGDKPSPPVAMGRNIHASAQNADRNDGFRTKSTKKPENSTRDSIGPSRMMSNTSPNPSGAQARNKISSPSASNVTRRQGAQLGSYQGERSSTKSQGSQLVPTSSSTTKTSNTSASSTTKASNTSASSSVRAPPKKLETLNPRLLRPSPAQHSTRLQLCNALYAQYRRLNIEVKKDWRNEESKKLVLGEQELIVKTLDDEQEIATKRYQIYGNVMKNRIMTYKKMSVSKWKEERASALTGTEPQGNGEGSATPKPIITGLTVPQEVDFLHRLVWPLDGLGSYGYVSSIPADDDIQKARDSVQTSGNVEVCDRCTRRFQVFPGRRELDGALTTNGSCTFHPGKTYFPPSGNRKKYRCCHQYVDNADDGCTTGPTHVFKTTDPNRLASLLNFAKTPPNPYVPADRAVCFDCEMGYTVYGMELLRLTVLSWPNYEILIDILVQPFGEVLDLNTRYSGVSPEDMVTAERWVPGQDHKPVSIPSANPANPANPAERAGKTKLKIAPSPKAARDLFFSLISPNTPVIGHGLENDLNALRVIHTPCIDTVLLYPHKRGLPIRHSLRYLTETHLDRKIQVETDQDAPQGHDSSEDAKAAGELVRLCVKSEWEQLQMRGWHVERDEVFPPF